MYPDLVGEFDVIDSTMPTIISASTKIRSIAEAAGFTLKNCGVTLNYEGESSYAPFAEKFKQCGVKGLWTSRSPVPAEFNFVKALDQAGIDRSCSVRPRGTATPPRHGTGKVVCSTTSTPA